MIIDAHAHYGNWYFPLVNPGAAEISEKMRSLGFDRAVFSSSLGIVYDFREGNAELAALLAGRPEFAGYVAVNLNYPEESLEEIERYLLPGGRSGFVGIKVHPLLSGRSFDCEAGLLFAEAAARHGAPLLVHTFGSALESPRNLLRAAERFPEASFIVGHMGGFAWEEGIAAAKAMPNLLLEICGTNTETRRIRTAVEAVGPERVLFGTDATLFAPEYVLGFLEDAGLGPEERDMIMGNNAARLFGFTR